MNNGKVRIYELSRDLNLDNKDILTICEQLNISVKSHSSTITEDEATRIRAAAKQVGGNATTAKKANLQLNTPDKSKNGARPPVRKQQILEIRHHQPSEATPPKPPQPVYAPDKPTPPSVKPVRNLSSDQPSDPSTTTSSAPLKPPSPPVRPAPPERPTAPRIEVEPVPVMAEDDSEPLGTPETLRAEESFSPSYSSMPPKSRPELVKPPSRPDTKSPDRGDRAPAPRAAAPSNAARPILKGERPQLKTERDQPRVDREAGPSRRADRPEIVGRPMSPRSADVGEAGGDGSGTALKPKPRAAQELRRPSRPLRPQLDTDEDDTSATSDDDKVIGLDEAVVEERSLRRPSPPKTSKRKGREEEDDEKENRKPGKVATKAKRRTQADLDDDDDFEEVLDQDAAADASATHLSLSLARPPKPKSKTPTAKPSAPSAPKSRKFEGRGDRQQRRREQESQVERPELLTLTSGITVHELAERMKVADTEIIRALFLKGIATNVNQTLDIPTIEMVAQEFGVMIETAEAESEARKVTEMLDATDMESLQRRPPVVTIMGHVDHGKTTLLDSIRKTKVAQGEAGGITQHIGAYHVDLQHGDQSQQIVFLDTPGHEAFTAMRARGTRVTDIAILVVAADDGVRPQTIEAISHAKAAGVPILVAINKIDKESAQPDRVKQELMEYGLVPEEWGGDVIMVPLSALTGENLDSLLEMILLVSEVEDLHANPDRLARGTVIEANLDKARGPVATLLVQNGTLHVGDILVVGSAFGKVRAMIDDRGHRVDAASPSFAVEVLGLNDVPAAGDEFEVYADEKEARALASSKADQQRLSRLQQAMASRRVTLNTLSVQAQEGDLKELNLLLKADVQGSVEAILAALQQLPQNEVQIRVLLAAPGEISETDVDLAAASGAVIVGFNTTLAPGARQAADRMGVDVRDYEIIYNLLDDIQGAMEGLLDPELVEESLGQVAVRAVFPVRKGTVAGCYVLSGKVTRNCRVRVMRNNQQIYEGTLDSLKRMKEDVKEVASGFECGIGIDGFNGWVDGDIIDAFRLVTKRRTLAMA